MTRKLTSALICIIASFSVHAQEADSLFAVKKDGDLSIKYVAKAHETARMLAIRFYVEEGRMEYYNTENTMRKLTEGTVVYIPVVKQNYMITKPPPLSSKNIQNLYYKVGPKDDLNIIGNYCGVPKAQLRLWNDLKGWSLQPGQALFIGWIRMMDKDSTNTASFAAYPEPVKPAPAKDTAGIIPVPGGLDTVYNTQTNNGLNVLTEKGTAAFFEKPGHSNLYYAFHNEVSRGAIIKVFNPGTGKSVYVKVLGPLPDTKLYANCIIGISDNAKEALGAVDSRLWCELSYAAD